MEDKSIVILGHEECDHVQSVVADIESKSIPCIILDTAYFPQKTTVAYNPEEPCLVNMQGSKISFDRVHSVYWRTYNGVNPNYIGYQQTDSLSMHDSCSLVESVLNERSPSWYNSYKAWRMHKNKPLQLKCVSNKGVKIPKTLITNDTSLALEFYGNQPDLIFKPVFGGAETEKVTAELMNETHLNKVFSSSPVTLQEFIHGSNIRTYVIDNEMWSAEILSDHIDFRSDIDHEITAIETPTHVQSMSKIICEQLNLRWTAIDWRRDASGEYFFLEANPSPMFIGFSIRSGIDIRKHLVRALTKGIC